MGVPALFRWLSKKYPKIIYPVVEDEEIEVPDENENKIKVPVNMASANPNGTEFDNLYLDMNGIVHPCTHPEGKPPPETEEEMMVEIFNYTERIVNMIRPRKLLFLAVDGVAPRAKMNQQRSRRFRTAQEAKEAAEARKEAVALWEAMGKEVSEEEKNKKSWDSNAITPGTPFMELLSVSLRYWVVKKMNSDSGWKQIEVIISDASVPGEGEHKIMDFIRRQRSNRGHDPNTSHIICGLDADLIMLALATHEPHFRVLREDVFAQSNTACRTCGQDGHYAAECTANPLTKVEKKPQERKPWIFLDVAILREYLEVELNVPNVPFPFNFEQSLDDWVLLIFFVGNDFLPHLPSLEIREGAIDTLLRIWKQELPRMGGYLTNHGHLELARAQIILEGVAQRENEIFRRRREAEERQNQESKRRKLEREQKQSQVKTVSTGTGPSPALALTTSTSTLSGPLAHPSLPPRPSFDFAAKADSIGFGAKPTPQSIQNAPAAAQALGGSNRDVVANRAAIRMANMSAAEMLKAELAGAKPVKPDLTLPQKPTFTTEVAIASPTATDDEFPGFGGHDISSDVKTSEDGMEEDADAEGEPDPDSLPAASGEDADTFLAGVKRKIDEVEDEAENNLGNDEDDAPDDVVNVSKALKVNPDGTVDQEDTIKLWEPGYRERYYRQKFGVEVTDLEFRKKLTKHYIEGLAWVLQYYYQGTPSWQWYYPYHFAPFASDFEELGKMDLKFELAQPFKPYEQLMGVFPPASRQHIPDVFHHLMLDDESPIIDFYPTTFEIDMNGKRMAWQGVALLPFIDQNRLLEAMAIDYPKLTEDQVRRNTWGHDVLFVSDDHSLYPFFESLYGKRKNQDPVSIDPQSSKGVNGSVLPNPDCIPGSTYYSPLPTQDEPDIKNDRSLTALYSFPKQLTPHRSVLLPGVKRPARQLSWADTTATQKYVDNGGGRGRGGYDQRGRGGGRGNSMFHNNSNSHYNNDRSYGNGNSSYQPTPYQQRHPYQSQQGYGGYNSGARPSSNYGGTTYNSRGSPPGRGAPPLNSQYNSYGSPRGGSYGASNGGSRGDYGSYGNYGRGGYGGYGSHGQASNGYGGYGGGGSYNDPRGRGRGGY